MPVLTATKPVAVPLGSATVMRPAAFRQPIPALRAPDVAVVLTNWSSPDPITAAVRGFRTVLPGADVFFYHGGCRPDCAVAAETAGAASRLAVAANPNGLLRRVFAEIDADIFILADGERCDPCLAPVIVAEIENRDRDFVNVARLRMAGDPAPDGGERLLDWTTNFLFGRGGTDMRAGYKGCSRRFARSYQAETGDLDAALTLTLHALKLRMPLGEVAAVGRPSPPLQMGTGRDARSAVKLLRLVAFLLVNERPRRVFGLAGLALVAAGIAVALPLLEIHDWHATLRFCPASCVSLGLMGSGAALGIAGTALDILAQARQEVQRLGYLAIPRRADRA
jgi:hypothetical protein